MKFKTDENLPVYVVELLRQEGHDALSTIEQQLGGHPDADISAVCQAEERALVTLDLDFSDVRAYPPEDHFGIVVLRPVLQTIPSLLRLTHQTILLLGTERLTGCLWIVEEHQIRIRGGTP